MAEYRLDEIEGKLFTKEQFSEFYGGDAEWEAAAETSQMLEVDSDE